MIPFTPNFLAWINPDKNRSQEIQVSELIKQFEHMVYNTIKSKQISSDVRKVIYFKIPKTYYSIKNVFLENISSNLEKEGFTYLANEDMIENENISRTYSFYTDYLKYWKLVSPKTMVRYEYNYESPLYVEYGALEQAIGIKICI